MPKVMVICLVSTILVEVILAIILKVRNKEDIITVILVNVLTNPIVSSVPVYFNYRYGLLYRNISLYTLEIITLIVEGIIYKKTLNYKKINPFLLSLILNVASYVTGLIIF